MNPREKNIAMVLGGLLGALFIYWIIIEPLWKNLDEATQAVEKQTEAQEAATNLFTNDTAARKKWKSMSGDLPSDSPTAETRLYTTVREAAQSVSVDPQSLRTERSDKENGFGRVILRVQANGNMAKIGRFLNSLQNASIPLRITDLQFTSRKGGTDDLSVSLGVATIYTLPDPKPTANTAKKETVE